VSDLIRSLGRYSLQRISKVFLGVAAGAGPKIEEICHHSLAFRISRIIEWLHAVRHRLKSFDNLAVVAPGAWGGGVEYVHRGRGGHLVGLAAVLRSSGGFGFGLRKLYSTAEMPVQPSGSKVSE